MIMMTSLDNVDGFICSGKHGRTIMLTFRSEPYSGNQRFCVNWCCRFRFLICTNLQLTLKMDAPIRMNEAEEDFVQEKERIDMIQTPDQPKKSTQLQKSDKRGFFFLKKRRNYHKDEPLTRNLATMSPCISKQFLPVLVSSFKSRALEKNILKKASSLIENRLRAGRW